MIQQDPFFDLIYIFHIFKYFFIHGFLGSGALILPAIAETGIVNGILQGRKLHYL
jgi:hypothetical protein